MEQNFYSECSAVLIKVFLVLRLHCKVFLFYLMIMKTSTVLLEALASISVGISFSNSLEKHSISLFFGHKDIFIFLIFLYCKLLEGR